MYGSQRAWVFNGDTGANPALWDQFAQITVDALAIEPPLATTSAHWPASASSCAVSDLRGELAHLTRPTDMGITHIKPSEVDAMMSEIAAQGGGHSVRALDTGDVMHLAA